MELKLILLERDREISRYQLGPGEYVIGRDSDCEVGVPSDAVSRRHARLTISESSVFIEDLGSANGTLVDGAHPDGRTLLQPGQSLLLGLVVVRLEWRQTDGSSLPAAEVLEPLDPAFMTTAKYDLGEVVAVGGMGVVRKARDLRVRRAVAMKLMSPESVETDMKRARFLEEGQVTGQLEHPNIVPVYDLGIDDDGQPFYTMKFVRGLTLKVVLDDIREGKQDTIAQFPLGRLLTIFQKACDAIAFAHSKGIIHRDLKPENIMIGDFGEVLVMDWGLAKRLSRSANHESRRLDESDSFTLPAFRTVTGMVMGTPHFMSPEQAAGKIDELDERTDIFALGGVLYTILTLTPPFPGDTAQAALRRLRAGILTPPLDFNEPNPDHPSLVHCPGKKIPDSLAAVAMKALDFAPDKRYPTVRDFQKDLDAYQGGFATGAEQAGAIKQLVLLLKRRKVEFSLAAVACLAMVIIGSASVGRIVASERRARASLESLRESAPAYASQAESLIDEHKFSEALGTIGTALELMPDRSDFHVIKGNILESLLRLPEALAAYTDAIKDDPKNVAAKQNYELVAKLLVDNPAPGELSATSLNTLQTAMLRQGRSAEALAMVRKLGQENQALYDTWKTILTRAGLTEITKDAKRLIVDDTGLFYLNLGGMKVDDLGVLKDMPLRELHLMRTEVRNLTPLKGAPLTILNATGTLVSDLEPLRGMPLKTLVLAGCKNVTDLCPLTDCRDLEVLVLPPTPGNLDCLRQLPKLAHIALPGRPNGARRGALLDETQPIADFWKEYDARLKGKE